MTQGPIDFSALDPAADDVRWQQRIAETVEQAALVRELDLASLEPFGGDEAAQREAVDRVLEATEQPHVLRLAPRALFVAAALAAAAWLLVFLDGGPAPQSHDPALAALSWASSGEPLSLEQMNAVTGSLDDAE